MANRSWDSYSATYRTEEVETLAEWIRRGNSGSVIGVAGTGKSNLLGFLCHRPEVIHAHWEGNTRATAPMIIAVDLDNLPAHDLATLYRVILRSFYQNRASLTASSKGTGAQRSTLQQQITDLYLETRTSLDPFLSQSALHALLGSFGEQSIRVVLVMDRFEEFCEVASPQILTALGGLRYKFKGILSYLIGMCRDIDYLADIHGAQRLYPVLNTHICPVPPMNQADAEQLIAQEMYLVPEPPNKEEQQQLLALTGRHPALLKAACHWWLTVSDEVRNNKQWTTMLLIERSIQYRLTEIWEGLSQKEQAALSKVQRLQKPSKNKAKEWKKLRESHHHLLQQLEVKGLCQRQELGWHIFSPLLSGYIEQRDEQTHGRIWLDEKSGNFYKGESVIEGLSPLTRELLHFFVKNPRTRHTKTDVIINVWSEEERKNGVSDESLYRGIREVRKLIEPPASPKPIHIISWRATRPLEGGYQFFPEG